MLLCSHVLKAQNWTGVLPFQTIFYDISDTQTTSLKFERIRVDSIQNISGGEEYYFCPTVRESSPSCLDIHGASWMGKKYQRLSNGDEYYMNKLSSSILIKTQAHILDTWLVLTDTNGISFEATVIGESTMSINNVIDSIKIISMQAYQNNLTISHVYNQQIVLSKNHGFIKTFPWYEFPYTFSYPMIPTLLDSTSYINQNVSSQISKYQAGNEWILRIDTFLNNGTPGWGTNPAYSHKLIHDSIISSTLLPNNTIAYESARKIFLMQDTNIIQNNSMLVYDTLANSSFYKSISSIFSDCSDGIGNNYYFSRACNNQIQINNDFIEGGFYSIGAFGDSCYAVFFPLSFQPFGNSNFVEGIGMIHKMDGYLDGIDVIEEMMYYKINDCTAGTKFNILLSASEFSIDNIIANNSCIQIHWKTRNEKNVSHFDIERSIDSKQFYKIAESPSLGNELEINQYAFCDNIQSIQHVERIYYRIKMIDLDDQYYYSNISSISFKEEQEIEVSPTVFQSEIKISNLLEQRRYQVGLKDVLGNQVYATEVEGPTSRVRNVGFLLKGVYFLTIHDVELNNSKTIKLIKQ